MINFGFVEHDLVYQAYENLVAITPEYQLPKYGIAERKAIAKKIKCPEINTLLEFYVDKYCRCSYAISRRVDLEPSYHPGC